MTEAEIYDLLCDQAMETSFLPREQVLDELLTWEMTPVAHEGAIIGAVLRKGAALHFATWRRVALTRAIMADALRPQLERYGYVETQTPHHARRQHRFNELIGFRPVADDGGFITYRLERDQCRLPL